jgi:hypothetical protein
MVKASRPEDFLALVPRLVGFPPRNSVVFVAFRGTRTCGALRYDLPVLRPGERDPDRVYARVATTFVGMFSKLAGVDAVVPVVFTDEPFAASSGVVHSAFVGRLLDRLRFSGFRVRDALCVAADAWGCYLDESEPPVPHDLELIERSSIHSELPDVARRLGDLDEWSSLPVVDPATKERVACRLRDLREARDSGVLSEDDVTVEQLQALPGLADLYRLGDLVDFIEAALQLEPSEISDTAAALLVFIVAGPALRDVVLMQWAFDREMGERVYDDAVRFRAGEPADSLDTARLMMGDGPRPDPARIEAALLVLKELAARAPRDDRPPLLCMLAWLNWALGRSTVAHRFLVAGAEIDEHYGLAEILGTMLDRGYLPEWAFDVE